MTKKIYFVTFVDEFIRYTWICLLQSKSEVFVVLKDFFSLIRSQFGVTFKTLRLDNRTEFFNTLYNKLFSSLGIVYQSSYLYTPLHNGVVERKHRYLSDVARALKFQSHIPIRFWGDCVKTLVNLINKLHTELLDEKSLYEFLYGKQPKIDHLRVFRCLCYANSFFRGDKFAPRGVLVGYS